MIQKEILNHQNLTKYKEGNEEAKLKTLAASSAKLSLEKEEKVEKETEEDGMGKKEEDGSQLPGMFVELENEENKKENEEKRHKTDTDELLLTEKHQMRDTKGNEVECSITTHDEEKVNENSQEVEKDEKKFNTDLNDSFSRITTDTISLELNTNCFIDGFDCDEDRKVAIKVSSQNVMEC